jgi:uncharacterized membrane protein
MPQWLVPIGRVFYAIALIGIGVQHFIFADFIPVMVPVWPAWIPGRPFWAYVAGAALIAAGAAIIFDIHARTVAALAGTAILVLVAIEHVPVQLSGSPGHLGVWTNAFKALTMGGGAWVVALSLGIAGAPSKRTSGITRHLETLMPFGSFFLAITMIVFGIDHFLYIAFVASLVPSWIPGAFFWTYFAGVALIAAGLAMIVGIQARLASLMLGIMIFLWLLLLHIPRAIADPHSLKGNEWTSVFEALAFSGIAFILAVQSPPLRLPESGAQHAVHAESGRSSA